MNFEAGNGRNSPSEYIYKRVARQVLIDTTNLDNLRDFFCVEINNGNNNARFTKDIHLHLIFITNLINRIKRCNTQVRFLRIIKSVYNVFVVVSINKETGKYNKLKQDEIKLYRFVFVIVLNNNYWILNIYEKFRDLIIINLPWFSDTVIFKQELFHQLHKQVVN